MVLRKLFALKLNLETFTSKLPNNRDCIVIIVGTRNYGFKSRNDQKVLQSTFGTPNLRRSKHFVNPLNKTTRKKLRVHLLHIDHCLLKSNC